MELKKEFTGVELSIKLTKEESEALALTAKILREVNEELNEMMKEKTYSHIEISESKYISDNYKSYISLIEDIYCESHELFETMENDYDIFENGFEIDTHTLN